MSDIAEATAVGELLVLNGRQKGTRVPLRLPATVIGANPGCDVRLTAAGVADVHCVVVATPAGPAVRSLVPESTCLNGRATAAALVRHGDELAVGPCTFRLVWKGATAPVPAAAPDEPPAAPWDLREREQSLHEQEHQLATLLEERQARVRELFAQLAEGREKLREERAAAAADRADAAAKTDAARGLHARRAADHDRTRRAAARLLRRTRAKCAADLAAAKHERSLLAAAQAQFAAEATRTRADADAHSARLRDGWAMLAESQSRLAADREEQERELSRLFQLLDARSEAVSREEAGLRAAGAQSAAERQADDDRGRALREEIAGLERRAENLRAAVADLDRRRAERGEPADAEFVPEALPVIAPVSLGQPDHRSAHELLTMLQYREFELDRERKALTAARAELDRRSEDLDDMRAVLAEQAAKLTADRREWQLTEAHSAAELEDLTRELDGREQAVHAREAAVARADLARRDRERDLSRLRGQLERWQAELTAHEARFYAEKDRAEADLAARWGRVIDREGALAEVCRVWGEVRTREREELRAELTRWAGERERFAAGLADFDRRRQELLADAGRVAALGLALEEARGAVEPSRRLRVLRKRWEGRFRRYAADLARRQEKLAAEATTAAARTRELHRLLATAADERAELADRRQAFDRARLAAGRPEGEEEPVILSLAEARRDRDAAELEAARREAELLAEELHLADDGDRAKLIYPLRLAG